MSTMAFSIHLAIYLSTTVESSLVGYVLSVSSAYSRPAVPLDFLHMLCDVQ